MILLNILNLIQEFKKRPATGGSKHAFFPIRVLSSSHRDFPYTTNTNPLEHTYYSFLEKVAFDCFFRLPKPPSLASK